MPLVVALFLTWALGFFLGQAYQSAPDLARLLRLGLLFFGGLVTGLVAARVFRRMCNSNAAADDLVAKAQEKPESALPGLGEPFFNEGAVPSAGGALWEARAIELQAPSAGLAQKTPEAAQRWENLAQASHALLGLLAQTLKDCDVALVRPVCVGDTLKLERCASKPGDVDTRRWAEPLMGAWADGLGTHNGPAVLTLGYGHALALPIWAEANAPEAIGHPQAGWVHLLVERPSQKGFAQSELTLTRTLGEQLALSHKLEVALKSSQEDLGRLAHLAITDGLTELFNRRHFEGVFALQLARATRYKRSLSLLLIDIDHFKSVNDTFGHAVGDEVLQDVARILVRTARCTDLVGRWGGEEFVVLMDETDLKGAVRVAERIREALVSEPLGHTLQIYKTASIGVAAFPEHGKRAADLIGAADAALYEAKNNGRDQIVSYQAHCDQTRCEG